MWEEVRSDAVPELVDKTSSSVYVYIRKDIVEIELDGMIGYKYLEKKVLKSDIENIKKRLSETDYVVIKIAEGAATADEYADVIAQRKLWREEINSLESADD